MGLRAKAMAMAVPRRRVLVCSAATASVRKGSCFASKEKPPSAQLLREAAAANPYKRPLLRMRARASYRGLMQFLNGLTALPYIAAPVWSNVSVGMERHPETKLPTRQWLEVEIRFAV